MSELMSERPAAALSEQLRTAHVDDVTLRLCGPTREGERRLGPIPISKAWVLDRNNGLLDVDASLRLNVVARICRDQGMRFPFARARYRR